MTTSSDSQPMRAELQEIVELVWATVLGDAVPPVESVEADGAPESCHAAELEICGAWNGVFTLEGDCAFAERLAAALFGTAGSDAAEQLEALCEVANMLAGNAKALLPGPSVLGLPEVREGAEVSSSSTRLTYSGSLGDRFAVTLTPAAGWGGVAADTGSAS